MRRRWRRLREVRGREALQVRTLRSQGAGGRTGFTLVEVLISLGIFALLALAGVSLLSFSVRMQGGVDGALDDSGAVERLSSILSADLAQAVPRQTRNEAGDLLPAFAGAANGGTTPIVRLVRGGWSNPDAVARPTLQKVEYGVVGGALVRTAYPMLDGAQPLPAATLLDHVSAVAVRYRTAGAWSDRWQDTPARPLPDALELSVTRDRGPPIRAMFLVGTGYAAGAPGAP